MPPKARRSQFTAKVHKRWDGTNGIGQKGEWMSEKKPRRRGGVLRGGEYVSPLDPNFSVHCKGTQKKEIIQVGREKYGEAKEIG